MGWPLPESGAATAFSTGRFYMTDKVMVMTTAASEEEGRRIGRELVLRQLAACVTTVPQVTSIYRWQGAIEEARECLLLIKTVAENFPQVRDAIKELHSYEVPECICLAVADGSLDYLAWIADSVITSEG